MIKVFVPLTDSEILVLGLGFNYAFTPAISLSKAKAILHNSLSSLRRKILLSLYFRENPSSSLSEPNLPRTPSTSNWEPDCHYPNDWFTPLANYYKHCLQALEALPLQTQHRPFDKVVCEIASTLGRRPDISIKPADKNLGVVVLPKTKYVELCNLHLSDTATYKEITSPFFL
ncbi:hypothetical protein EON64_00375, partial [archaeon]